VGGGVFAKATAFDRERRDGYEKSNPEVGWWAIPLLESGPTSLEVTKKNQKVQGTRVYHALGPNPNFSGPDIERMNRPWV